MIIAIRNTITGELRLSLVEPTDILDLEDHEEIEAKQAEPTDCYARESNPDDDGYHQEIDWDYSESRSDRYENFRNQE